jgi:hypothetical protein
VNTRITNVIKTIVMLTNSENIIPAETPSNQYAHAEITGGLLSFGLTNWFMNLVVNVSLRNGV